MSQTFMSRSAFDTWPIAKPTDRIFAFLIDSLIVATIVFIAVSISSIETNLQSYFLFWLIAMWFWEITTVIFFGTSPGKKVFKLELYSPRHDGPPSPSQISIRVIMFWIGLFMLGIGLISIFSRKDHRGWHDLIAETLVVGPSRSNPHPMMIKMVPVISLVLSLVLFSGIGARIFSQGLKLTQEDKGDWNFCPNIKNITKNTEKTLASILISPAWTSCWIAIENTHAKINDARIYRLLQIAKDYHHMFMLDTDLQEDFYHAYINPAELALCQNSSKECNTVRFLNAVKNNQQIDISEHWLQDFEDEIRKLNMPFEDLVASLPQFVKANKETSLLWQDLWIAMDPSKAMDFQGSQANFDWYKTFYCLDLFTSNKTRKPSCRNWFDAFRAVESAKLGNRNYLDSFLSSQPRDLLFMILSQSQSYFDALSFEGEEEARRVLKAFPKDFAILHLLPN